MRRRLLVVAVLLLAGPLGHAQTLEQRVSTIEAALTTLVPAQSPTAPSPASGASVAAPVTLTWQAPFAASVNVRFGTSSSPSQVASGVTGGSYTPTGLVVGKKYYWQIQSVGKGTKLGPIWSFTVAAPPSAPPPATPPPVSIPTGGLPVVPGAQGYGLQTRAAYGGPVAPTVYRVTTLADRGTGSLRAALEASVPRVVIFEVGGYVDLADMIRITSPYLTVAGQTAPSPGITLRKYGIEVQTHDVLLQQFRIRPGEWGQASSASGLIAWGPDAHDIVLDHMSVSWGPDENIAADTYYGGDMNLTVWRSITAESLDFPPSSSGNASHGMLVQAQSQRVSVAQTLFVGNRERNPYAQSGTSLAAVNNLIFNAFANWHFFFSNYDINGNPGGGPWAATIVGNRVIAGPNTDDDSGSPQGWLFYIDKPGSGNVAGNQLYRNDNTVDNPLGIRFDLCPSLAAGGSCNEMNYDPSVAAPPTLAPLTGFVPVASTAVEALVLAHAGARPLDRDAIDARIIDDVKNRRGRGYFRTQDVVGGYPAVTPTKRALTLPADLHTVSSSGYTNLELWLQGYSKAVGE